MERVLEPELMNDVEQATIYARADFSRENQWFVDCFTKLYPDCTEGAVVDLGCGPGDIPIRMAKAISGISVIGVDGSQPMIDLAREAVAEAALATRIQLMCQRFQGLRLPTPADALISNSLVHHVPNPLQFWFAVKQLTKPGGAVLVMDLLRPESSEDAQAIVDRYAADEPDQLRTDFYNSLLSAFTEDEVAAQLAELNLSRLLIDVPDDRHWIVYGRVS